MSSKDLIDVSDEARDRYRVDTTSQAGTGSASKRRIQALRRIGDPSIKSLNMGLSTHEANPNANTINSFRLQKMAVKEGSAGALNENEMNEMHLMASNELYVVPSQVSMAIYNNSN